jgi:hypothetical protein
MSTGIATSTGGYGVANASSLAWGLCYNHELSPSQSYCDDSNELYRCAEGVEYYGRGALPVYWSGNMFFSQLLLMRNWLGQAIDVLTAC